MVREQAVFSVFYLLSKKIENICTYRVIKKQTSSVTYKANA